MRSMALGLLLVPGMVTATLQLGRPSHVASASPVDARPASAKVLRALEGRFVSDAVATPEGTLPALAQRACRVQAPSLGERVLYVEQTLRDGASRPISQRVLVIDGHTATHARVREFTLVDPAAMAGACEHPERVTLSPDQVDERTGCMLSTRSLAEGPMELKTRGVGCATMLNGADHLERSVVVRDDGFVQTDLGVKSDGSVTWGDVSRGRRFVRAR